MFLLDAPSPSPVPGLAFIASIGGAFVDWKYVRKGGRKPTRRDQLFFLAAVGFVCLTYVVLGLLGATAEFFGRMTVWVIIILFGTWELGRWRVRHDYPLSKIAAWREVAKVPSQLPSKFCSQCGQKRESTAKFCPECGASFGPQLSMQVEPAATSHESESVQAAIAKRPESISASPVGPERPMEAELASIDAHSLATIPQSPAPQAIAAQIEYAPMGERFLAYLADLVVVYLVVFGLYFVSGLFATFGHGFLSSDASEAQGIGVIVLVVYMTVALSFYHTTIGKFTLGLEVASDDPSRPYPSFWRVLLRETVGRFVSFFFFAIGYWKAIRNPKKKAASDDMARTVVRRRPTNSTLRKALTAFIIVGFFLDGGMVVWGYQVDADKKAHDAWVNEISSLGSQVAAARQTATDISNRDTKNWQDVQADMTDKVAALDKYDNLLDRYDKAIQRGDSENIVNSETEREQTRALIEVVGLRKQQSAKERQEANLVLGYDPSVTSAAELQAELKALDSDITALNNQATDKLTQAGLN